jgi:pimeloyl-ACP methyl ester carboxylesterase
MPKMRATSRSGRRTLPEMPDSGIRRSQGWEERMPNVTTDDDVKLYYEETGTGTPIIFVHEFAGDHRSWEPQVRHFSRSYRCITYNARGYPPSDVPLDGERYSQDRACDDIRAVLDGLKIDKAHVVGLSMGGFATLHFGITYGARARSLVIAGCGYGAALEKRAQFAEEAEASAKRFEELGMAKASEAYALGPTRVQYQNKIGTINVPTLVMTGDEDWPCLEPALLMKRNIRTAALVMMPNAGHGINLEDPDAFNAHLAQFFHAVDIGAWRARDPRAMVDTVLGR